jgi:hypothetical protein
MRIEERLVDVYSGDEIIITVITVSGGHRLKAIELIDKIGCALPDNDLERWEVQ